MIIKPHFEGLSTSDTSTWQATLDDYASRQLRPMLQAHGVGNGVLHATLRRLSKRQHTFEAELYMHLPGKKIITAMARGEQVPAVSERAVDRLFREAKRHFAQLHGQGRDRRTLRKQRLDEIEQRLAALPAPVAEQSRQGIEALLRQLTPVATRELAYLRASGDLPAGYPTVTDVVDEAAAQTRAAWKAEYDASKVYQQLLKHLFKAIDHEVAAVRPYAEAESIDAEVAPDAEDQAEAMVQEEVYEYYQPDDSLSLADVLPAADTQAEESAPEKEGEDTQAEELAIAQSEDEQPDGPRRSEQAYALNVVKALPIVWRRALLLRAFDDLSNADIASVLEVEEAAVNGWIDQSCSFVQARLTDAGVPLPTGHAREVVLTLLQTRR